MMLSVSWICLIFARLAVGYIIDKVCYRVLVSIMLLAQIVICSTIYYAVTYKHVFFAYILIEVLISGCLTTITASNCGKVYGTKIGSRVAALSLWMVGLGGIFAAAC
jgi:hypothetical protein